MRIDAHHHFWNYSQAEYGWIGEGMERLQRDFLPGDLQQVADGAKITGVVSVQARQTVAETEWLIGLARENELVQGVVGWAPLREPDVAGLLERWTHEPWLKSIRHVVQDEADGFLDDPAFNEGITSLRRYNLAYDILIYGRQLSESIRFVDRHPEQKFVLDHIAKPAIKPQQFDTDWERGIRELSKRENVACKFSGVATEVRGGRWDLDTIRPYWDVALDAFGAKRLMYGSDWPVCLLAAKYPAWIEACETLAAGLSQDQELAFWAGNATEWYRL